ncbi:cysteine hydrolase family protein [Kitasatospora paracochleata]|uniref:Nicotinamidase-related amidase n=1 Tax=Kitasatospora paracochleata TaxID=58354 RepID=A0ABT1IS66_9ACTN|nr:cysteine hydrolase family protein [Kitasatospora paracochleata]MCP2307959.1 nicotinamidase-related amidase [Kitasatospora paracochleata]
MTNTSAFDAPLSLSDDAVLIVIDVQQGFEDEEFWGERDNPGAERRIADLVAAWERTGRPIVTVQHGSARGPLEPGTPGYELKPVLADVKADLHITKTVNSAFYGTPDLHAWLQERGATQLVTIGIMTNVCNETTARMGGNLGYDVIFPVDAMHTFAMAGPDGESIPAEQLAKATAAVLHTMRFAKVVTTEAVLAAA